MKPLANQHAYANLVKSTKNFLLLLSSGIVLFLLIMLLQLFSYFSQPGIPNNSLPEVPKNAGIMQPRQYELITLSKMKK